MRSSVSVSPDEVKAEFVRKNRQVNLEYMRFASRRQDAEVAPTDDEIAAYAAKNEAKLKEIYEQKKFLYEKAPAQRRIRQILIKVPHDADDKADKAARDKADALAEKLKRGAKASGKEGLTFTELARQSSEDTATKARGGDLGWRARGGTNLQGDAEDKLFAAKEGAIVGPLKGNDGYVITKVEGAREGHVPFEKAKLELAEEKLAAGAGRRRAKAAAEAALAKAKETPTADAEDDLPAAQRHPGGERERRRRLDAARRGDGAVLAARDARRRGRRGDRRLERAGQGRLRADDREAARRAVRDRRQLLHRSAQGTKGTGPRRLRQAQAGAGARSGEDQGRARAGRLDAAPRAWRRRTRSASR